GLATATSERRRCPERRLEAADEGGLLALREPRRGVVRHQRVVRGWHRAALDRFHDVRDAGVLWTAPLREVERRAAALDVALDPPGNRRDVRVPRPLRLVAVAVEACLDREGPRLRRVPGRLLEHGRI